MIKRIAELYRFFRPLIRKINHDNIFAISGQSAFFLLLSLVPFSMFMVSVLQNLHIPVEQIERVFGLIFNEETTRYFSEFLGNVRKDAGSISLITIFFTLWSAAQGIHAITNGVNRIHHTYENRNWFLLRLRAMFYTVIVLVILLASMLVIVLGSSINNALTPFLEHLPDIVNIIYSLRYVLVFLYLVIFFALMYRTIPNFDKQTRRGNNFLTQLPGAVLCAVSWFGLSFGISFYVDNFNGFSVYGSLAKIAVLMVWLYFCIVFLMIGAELNCVYHPLISAFVHKHRKHKKNSDKEK